MTKCVNRSESVTALRRGKLNCLSSEFGIYVLVREVEVAQYSMKRKRFELEQVRN